MNQSRTSYHHGDLYAAVLRRAEEVLRESGVERLSLRQIARDVGVSHGAPSRHFGDKQGLLDALAVVGLSRLGAAFKDASAEMGSFRERLLRLARTYLRFAVENPALLDLMFARKHSPTAGSEISDEVHRAFAIPMALVADAQERGEVVAGDPQRIGMSAIASLQGLAHFVGSGFVSKEAAGELLDETMDHLVRGLKPRS